jgi:hypothetical protein
MYVYVKHDKEGNILSFGTVIPADGLGAGGPLELVSTDPRITVTRVDLPDIPDQVTIENHQVIAELLAKTITASKIDLKWHRLVGK